MIRYRQPAVTPDVMLKFLEDGDMFLRDGNLVRRDDDGSELTIRVEHQEPTSSDVMVCVTRDPSEPMHSMNVAADCAICSAPIKAARDTPTAPRWICSSCAIPIMAGGDA